MILNCVKIISQVEINLSILDDLEAKPLKLYPPRSEFINQFFPISHFIGCNCHISGSEDRVCDQRTGQCKCRSHVIGRTCDRCERGYWNIDSKNGCAQCSCNVNGSEDQGCDTHTGQCYCKPGVEGPSCDRCRPGYFGFSSAGCKRE